MRVIFVTLALAMAAACSWQRPQATRPEPQKSALTQCPGQYPLECGPPPLLIVDGKRMDFALTDLETLQIEQVDVLKGPAAIARYGEAAKYGAIIITSKIKSPLKP